MKSRGSGKDVVRPIFRNRLVWERVRDMLASPVQPHSQAVCEDAGFTASTSEDY
jgi:hypothetical protein